jgi:hypothetical protein
MLKLCGMCYMVLRLKKTVLFTSTQVSTWRGSNPQHSPALPKAVLRDKLHMLEGAPNGAEPARQRTGRDRARSPVVVVGSTRRPRCGTTTAWATCRWKRAIRAPFKIGMDLSPTLEVILLPLWLLLLGRFSLWDWRRWRHIVVTTVNAECSSRYSFNVLSTAWRTHDVNSYGDSKAWSYSLVLAGGLISVFNARCFFDMIQSSGEQRRLVLISGHRVAFFIICIIYRVLIRKMIYILLFDEI